MPEASFQGMELVSAEDADRILKVTDALQLHRDWVIIPIDAVAEGREFQQPDGKLILHAPVRARFEAWLAGLRGRLEQLNLGAIPRAQEADPKLPLTGPHEIRPQGTRNYLGPLGVLKSERFGSLSPPWPHDPPGMEDGYETLRGDSGPAGGWRLQHERTPA